MSEENQVVQPSPDTTIDAVQPDKDTALKEYKSAASADERIAAMHKLGMLDEKQQEKKQSEVKPAKTPETSGETPQEEQPAAGGEEQPKPYTPEEIKAADLDKLDYKRLPPDLVPYYNSMRAAQTKKSQEIAERERFLRELAQELQKPPAARQPEINPAQVFAQRHNFIAGKVAEIFGVSPGELDGDTQFWTPEQRLAYSEIRDRLSDIDKRQEYARQEAERSKNNFVAFTESLEAELKAADPEAYDYAMARLNRGEVLEKDKNAIIAALTKGDKLAVAQYFEQFRKEYRGEKPKPQESKKQSPEPPMLETGGQGKPSAAKPGPKVSEYKGADQATRVKLMKQWGLLD